MSSHLTSSPSAGAPAPTTDDVTAPLAAAMAAFGLVVRPLTTADSAAVFELMAQDERDILGEAEIEEADLVGDSQRPSFDLGTQSIGVLTPGPDPRLVGYAEVYEGRWGAAAVAVAHRGRGIGTALATWMQAVSRRDGRGLVGMPVPAGSPGDRLLAALGYAVAWTSWVLALPPGAQVQPQPLPTGYTVRTAEPGEYRAVHDVIEDAFLEWSVRERERFEDFAASTVRRPGFEPWHLRVVTDETGTPVGACLLQLAAEGTVGYVARLAVRRDHRGRGLARALLVDAFALAREHGAEKSELSTDSRTGALGLYERVGMVVTSTWVHRVRDTGPGA